MLGEGERIRRLKLKADDGFDSLEGMLEPLSHDFGLLELDDGLSWSCSLDQGGVCDSLN